MRLRDVPSWEVIAKLDFDSPRIPADFIARCKFLLLLCSPETEEWTRAAPRFRLCRYRSTNGGWHVEIRSDRVVLGPREQVAVQAILGSHWRREAFNLVRAVLVHEAPRAWRTRWNTLYRQKGS